MTQQNRSKIHAVGVTYDGWRAPTDDGAKYNYRYGHHELALILSDPTAKERQDFQRNEPQFAYWWDRPVLWVLVRIPDMEWTDAPYTMHLVEPEGRIIRWPEPGMAAPVTMMMVDGKSGKIVELRVATMSHAMTADFARIARAQLRDPFDEVTFNRVIRTRWAQFHSSDQMVEHANRIGVLGGRAERDDMVKRAL